MEMEQVFTTEKLTKKFVRDIMFENSDFCRINVAHVYRDKPNVTKKFMVNKDGLLTVDNIPSSNVRFTLSGRNLLASYTYKDANYALQMLDKDNNKELSRIVGNVSDIVMLTVYRYTNAGVAPIVWPIIYSVSIDDKNNRSVEGYDDRAIVEDFVNGGKTFYFEHLYTNVRFKMVQEVDILLDGNDNEINNGFDIGSTADFFEVRDLDLFKKTNSEYVESNISWNPDTKILSHAVYNKNFDGKDEDIISVYLYYIENIDDIESPKDINDLEYIFAYDFYVSNPTHCYVNDYNEDKFYSDDHVHCDYDADINGIITSFSIVVDEEVIVKAELDLDMMKGSEDGILKITDADDNIIIYMQFGIYGGKYIDTSVSFMYINSITDINDIKSFVYDYENLYIRSLGWNLIKIK